MNGPHEPNVTIGDVSGSTFAIGSHASAVSRHGTARQPDEATEQLLAAVRELRADLSRVRGTEQSAALDAELAGAEEEITATGQAGPSRRDRLRRLLADSQSLLSVLASAGSLAGQLGL
ncbi:hypothetical protein [Streptomyces tropicalis]|uniref:Uncharacterized protein n=1 Tax=Streptomyces tropicalis TaxID=3034234 RepID=A0ABT6A0X7_9ACTN|nr:hypothetical protein [Streptomyces tropicalis]MDF3298303.1 hypothetical protein [Streptomyces tropicalis]